MAVQAALELGQPAERNRKLKNKQPETHKPKAAAKQEAAPKPKVDRKDVKRSSTAKNPHPGKAKCNG